MLETPHVTVGAAIASKIPNPLIAIPLAFASHFVLERVPHWNPHLNREIKKFGKVTTLSTVIVIADVATSLIIGFYFASQKSINNTHYLAILASSFASVLPDVIEGPYFYLKVRGKLIERWISFQKSLQEDAPIVPGLATQILTILACFYWVF